MHRWRMPTYSPDIPLLTAITDYVRDAHGGVVKRAAEALMLDYIMLRRFLTGGRAKPENRQLIRNALDAAGWSIAKDRKIAHEIPVDVTRSMLTQLLEALDLYQDAGAPSGGRRPDGR